MARRAQRRQRNQRRYEAEEWVEFVLEGMAENGVEVTPELQTAADNFETAVDEALDVCFEKFPPAEDPSALYGDPGTAFDIYATIAGEGVGIWDGRWDAYYPDYSQRKWQRLGSCFRRALAQPYSVLESELMDAAYARQNNPVQRRAKRLASKLSR